MNNPDEPTNQPSSLDDQSLTREDFCKLERISLSTFHKLKRAGKGPKEMHYPKMSCVRISAKARRAWQLKMEKESQSKASKLEDARRREIASVVGKKAAKSLLHVSKRGKGKAAPTKKPVRLARRSTKG